MKTMLQRVSRHQTALAVAALRAALYAGLVLLFFGLMAVNNWQLLHLSRTLATTLLTWVAMTMAMTSVYGGYDVGRRKSKPLISSLSLAVLVTDVVTYLQLQIMNVNENNNHHLELFGRDFPWLILCMALQVVFIIFLTYRGNKVYFRLNPPRKCLLVLSDMSRKAYCARKIGRYALQWQLSDVVLWNDAKIERHIRQAEVVFLDSGMPDEIRQRLLKYCYNHKRDVIVKAQLQDIMISSARQVVVDDAPFLEMDYHKITLGQRIIKRCMDVFCSGLALVVLSPLLGLVSLAIYLEDGAPIIFRQKRATINGRTFTICKFRTMKNNAPAVSATEDDDRITRVGHWLRRLRIDELPQLWNILTGDMTLVGPRPEMMENVEKYKLELPAFAYREKMKAGLTGYAQIEGRYNTTPEDKLMLDLMYIESFSLWEDIKLIFRTLTVFFKSDSTQGFAQEEEKKDVSA